MTNPTDSTGLYVDKPGAISLSGGTRVDPLDLQPCDVNIADIAHSLARQCRYLGHCAGFLSVARHSLWVSQVLERRKETPVVQKIGLLHDAAEAYLGDIVRPLKWRPEMDGYRDAEARAERAIAMAFGLPWPWPEAVHEADREVLMFELADARHKTGGDFGRDERQFLKRYVDLRRQLTEVGQP